jgi:hypothetical protein
MPLFAKLKMISYNTEIWGTFGIITDLLRQS